MSGNFEIRIGADYGGRPALFLAAAGRLRLLPFAWAAFAAFFQSGIWRNMFLLEATRPETLAQFPGQYLASALLFYLLPHLLFLGPDNRLRS